jgi:ABC-type multidrug transport system ATPase subunit
MATAKPKLQFSADFTIGYGAPLARTREEIHLEPGTHYLIGRNGRGKTTLLRTVADCMPQLGGQLERCGSMRYNPEGLRFDAELTPTAIFNALLPKSRRKEAIEFAKGIELDVKKGYGKLSTGNRRKTLLIATEFATLPDESCLLLLDEPFSGLDAFAREAFEKLWRQSAAHVLRLVSCHPDYDSMEMRSAVIISDGHIDHRVDENQTWSQLKTGLN